MVAHRGPTSTSHASPATVRPAPLACPVSEHHHAVVRRLILWDVDGTLIRTGGVGARAIEAGAAAAAALVDVPSVTMSGKTDPQILREIFCAADIDDDRITEILPRAVAEVERVLAETEEELRRSGSVLPGVIEVLERLGQRPGVRQTVLTGNLAANAAVKLTAFGLTRYLDAEIGAYGTDDPDRHALVPVALERAERLRGDRYDRSEVWVVGDTANDLACARAGAVRCLLVGTGKAGFDGVRELPADAVLADLGRPEEVLAVLLS